jgi:hypothetical protein
MATCVLARCTVVLCFKIWRRIPYTKRVQQFTDFFLFTDLMWLVWPILNLTLNPFRKSERQSLELLLCFIGISFPRENTVSRDWGVRWVIFFFWGGGGKYIKTEFGIWRSKYSRKGILLYFHAFLPRKEFLELKS